MKDDEIVFGDATGQLREGVNKAARAGDTLIVYSTVEQNDDLFALLKELAKKSNTSEEVKTFFSSCLNENDPRWAGSKVEPGILVFRGDSAGLVAEKIKKIGGKVLMIPGINVRNKTAILEPRQESYQHLRPSKEKRKIKIEIKRGINEALEVVSREQGLPYTLREADIYPLYLMESPFANRIENSTKTFYYDGTSSARSAASLEKTVKRRIEAEKGTSPGH